MSTWTNERHEAARARCEAATSGPWDDQPGRMGAQVILTDDGYGLWDAAGLMNDADGPFIAHARTDLEDALDEIERLRAESARRMVWLENEQRAHQQTHAALVDMTERAAERVQITDDMVERAAEALVYTMGQESDGACWISEWEGWTVIDGTFDMPSAIRVALEAALNPKGN